MGSLDRKKNYKKIAKEVIDLRNKSSKKVEDLNKILLMKPLRLLQIANQK